MAPTAKTTDMTMVLRAAEFAATRHRDQRRKGPEQEPYINHLIEVTFHLSRSGDGHDAILLASGFLHDTVEDTATTLGELDSLFGPEVALVVAEVTDDKSLRKDERKRLQIETIAKKSRRAQLLSIADKTANVGSLVRAAPTDWTRGRIVEYGAWAEQVVVRVRGTDAYLETAFAMALAQLRTHYSSR